MSANEDEQNKTEHFNIKLLSDDNSEVIFRIKKSTPMKKVFDAFAKQKNVDVNSLRFLFDGNRILDTATAESVGLENMDTVDVAYQQTGGKK